MGSLVDALLKIERLTFARGRVALAAILTAMDIVEGDEVITQAFTCVAVPEAIMAVGAIPIYVDIEREGFNIDPAALVDRITPKTRVIIVQHTFGAVADMTAISKIAEKHDLPIIEDCCHSFLSTHDGRRVGTIGQAAFYSYEWGKPIVCGVGGSAFSQDATLVERINKIREGFSPSSKLQDLRLALQYRVFDILYRPRFFWQLRNLFRTLSKIGLVKGNYNPVGEGQVSDDFSRKMANAPQKRLKEKLKNVDKVADHADNIASVYRQSISSSYVKHPEPLAGTKPVYARYPLRVEDKSKLLVAARKANVELAEWYVSPIHPLEESDWHKVHYMTGTCPNAEQRCDEIVSLPTNSRVSEAYLEEISRLLNLGTASKRPETEVDLHDAN